MKSYLLAPLLLLSWAALAQPDFRFHRYGIGDGLPSPGIREVIEDRYGFIWVGTNDGLAQFNGYEFKVFRKTRGQHAELTSNDITSLFPLESGDLLVGTNTGLNAFDHKKQKFRSLWPGLPESYISKILADGKGGFWVSSSTGLYYLPKIDSIPTAVFPDNSAPLHNTGIFSMYLDTDRQLWITTSRKGFFRVNTNTKEVKNYRHNPDDPASLSSDVMRQITALPDGRLVLGTASAGYNVFDPKTETFTRYNHNPDDPTTLSSTAAFALLADSKQQLWVGTWANGLNVINTQTWKGRYFKNNPDDPYSLSNNSITCLFESSGGDLWVGSSSGGVCRLTPREQLFHRYRYDSRNTNSLSIPFVRSLLEDRDGKLWLGTNQGGLNRFDPITQQYTVYLQPDESRDALSRGTIWSISEGENDKLWLGTSRGVALFDKKTGKANYYPYGDDGKSFSGNNVLKVLDDHKGNLWVGIYNGGLNRMDTRTGKITIYPFSPGDATTIPTENVNDLLLDHAGRLWVLCDSGLGLFDESTGTFKRYLNAPADPSLFQIAEGKDERLYIATSAGVAVFDVATEKTEYVGEEEGLIADHANSVLVDDDGQLWVATNFGVTRYNPATGSVAHFSEVDGLVHNDTEAKACFKSKDGRMYFGGTGGATSFHPRDLANARPAPKLAYTGLSILNKPVVVSDTTALPESLYASSDITLQYSDYVFAVEFAALEFDLPSKIKYAYQLEGLDANWIYTDANDRKAVFTNLSPGRYVLKVKASDATGAFTDDFVSLGVRVIPPWWKTWWARVFFYGAVVAIAFGIFRARIEFVRKQNRLLEEQVAARTAEVSHQKEELEAQAEALEKANAQKNKLFSIIAHDLKTPLNSLKGIVALLDPRILTAEDLGNIRADISKRVDGLSAGMENLLEWASGQLELEHIHIEKVNVPDVMGEIVALHSAQAAKKQITLRTATENPVYMPTDVNMLRGILRNLTANAIKFTEAGGSVTLSVEKLPDEYVLRVTDTGVGMDSERAAQLFSATIKSTAGTEGERGMGLGLQVVNDFTRKLGGRLWVVSSPGAGTTFFIAFKAS